MAVEMPSRHGTMPKWSLRSRPATGRGPNGRRDAVPPRDEVGYLQPSLPAEAVFIYRRNAPLH